MRRADRAGERARPGRPGAARAAARRAAPSALAGSTVRGRRQRAGALPTWAVESAASTPAVYPSDTVGKHRVDDAVPRPPRSSLSPAALVVRSSRPRAIRRPSARSRRRRGGGRDSSAEEAVRHALAAAHCCASRLDPGTATGLALTLALAVAIVGGLVLGVLAYLMRSSGTLVGRRRERRPVGRRPRDAPGRRSCSSSSPTSASTPVRRSSSSLVVCVVEYVRVPNRWIAAVPDHGRRRRGRARQHDQAAPRPRPPDLQPDRRDARALVPERSLRDGRGALRGRRARAGPAALARGRVRCSPAAPSAIAVGVACSRVHARRPLALGRRSPASPSAGPGSRSARSRSAAGSSTSARRSRRRHEPPSAPTPSSAPSRQPARGRDSDVVEVALQRAEQRGGGGARRPGARTSRWVSGSPLLDPVELLGRRSAARARRRARPDRPRPPPRRARDARPRGGAASPRAIARRA